MYCKVINKNLKKSHELTTTQMKSQSRPSVQASILSFPGTVIETGLHFTIFANTAMNSEVTHLNWLDRSDNPRLNTVVTFCKGSG